MANPFDNFPRFKQFLAEARLESLKQLSATKPDEGKEEEVEYAFEGFQTVNIEAVDFEAATNDWYVKTEGNLPCKCDALYCDDSNTIFLIEFKTKGGESLNINRKLYDSEIALIENTDINRVFCRENLCYLVVNKAKPGSEKDLMKFRDLRRLKKPWLEFTEKLAKDYALRSLWGILCKRAFTLTPVQFNHFIDSQNWHDLREAGTT